MASSKNTITTLIAGVIVSIMFGLLVATLIRWGLWEIISASGRSYTRSAGTIVWANALFIGSMLGFGCFWLGHFTVKPGEQAFLLALGAPLKEFLLGAGYGSTILPGIIAKKIEKVAGVEINPTSQVYTTNDGVDVTVDPSALYEITDTILVQNIQEKSVVEFMTSTLRARVRAYISKLKAELGPVLEDLDKDSRSKSRALELLGKIAQLKNGISTEGTKEILEEANKIVGGYGLLFSRVQIENVRLPEEIESAAKTILKEILQSASVPRDWHNKDDAVKVIVEAYKRFGVDWEGLPNETRARYISEAFENVLASEDQAEVKAQRFGFHGKPPQGMIIGGGTNG